MSKMTVFLCEYIVMDTIALHLCTIVMWSNELYFGMIMISADGALAEILLEVKLNAIM